MKEWVCSDPDCAQHFKKDDEFHYEFIEAREFEDCVVVCFGEVNLLAYTFDEIWNICSGYYESFEQMVADYGFREAFRIMAECIFEQTPLMDFEYSRSVMKFQDIEDAYNYINIYIGK